MVRQPAANVLVWGLTLVLLLSPVCLGLAFAFPNEGNPYLGEADTPNGFFQFLAGALALVGVIMTLVGVHRAVSLIDVAGSAMLEHLNRKATRGK
jgi:hypothetical protein